LGSVDGCTKTEIPLWVKAECLAVNLLAGWNQIPDSQNAKNTFFYHESKLEQNLESNELECARDKLYLQMECYQR